MLAPTFLPPHVSFYCSDRNEKQWDLIISFSFCKQLDYGFVFFQFDKGNLTPFLPAIRSHTLWRRRSVLLLIRIDRSYCRNNKNRLLRSLGAPPKSTAPPQTHTHAHTPPSMHNSSGTSTRHPHQLWRSSEYHPLHPISWRNHCFTTISIPLFIRKPHAHTRDTHKSAHRMNMEELKSSQNAKETTSSSSFIHDLNSVPAQTNPELMLIKQKRASLGGETDQSTNGWKETFDYSWRL